MARPLDPFTGDAVLPARTRVVVIGGGIIGVATALELAERGVPTVLCEKGVIGGEQSSRNWGWCRQMGRDSREVPLAMESLRLWRRMNERVGAETGFRQAGIVYLAETEEGLAADSRWADEHARPYQLDTRVLTRTVGAADAGRRRSAGRALSNRMRTGGPSRARQPRRLPQRRGAPAPPSSPAAPSAVSTSRPGGWPAGHREGPDRVRAGGARRRRLVAAVLRQSRHHLPQLMVVNSVARTEPIDAGIEVSGACPRFALRRRLDGGCTVAHGRLLVADIVPDSFRLLFAFLPAINLGELRFRVGRRFIDEWRLARRWVARCDEPVRRGQGARSGAGAGVDRGVLWRDLKAVFPAFRDARVAERWAGYIDATPDAVPVISPVDSIPGFYLATGFSGHGFGIGPGAGKLMADIVTGATTPVVDPAPFRYARFIDGSRIAPMGAR